MVLAVVAQQPVAVPDRRPAEEPLSQALKDAMPLILLIVLLIGYGVFMEVTDYHDFEGTTAMGLAYMSPVLALICGIAVAALFVYISKPRRTV